MEELGFVTWDMFLDYSTFVMFVFMAVEFTKELKYIKQIPTRYWSAIISLLLLMTMHLHNGTFELWDIVLYIFTAMSVSLTSNGLANFNRKGE